MRHSEHSVVELLRARYTRNAGNGPEYAFMRGVRNAAGYGATRSFDAVAIALWPSRHLELTIFEVKVSRSDWLRELKANPNGGTTLDDKAGHALELADRFVVVAPAGIVRLDELPPGWGLLEVVERAGVALRMVVEPALLKPREWSMPNGRTVKTFRPLPRGFVVAMLRRTNAVGERERPSYLFDHGEGFKWWPVVFS